jgi:hypothetical protein
MMDDKLSTKRYASMGISPMHLPASVQSRSYYIRRCDYATKSASSLLLFKQAARHIRKITVTTTVA